MKLYGSKNNYRLNLFKKAASNTDIIDIDQTVINYHILILIIVIPLMCVH